MSALPPKADMCGATRDVRSGPIADIARFYSMTASARRRKASGILSPSACAVVRLMTSSNPVGCSTRISAGLAPLRILSTISPARRNRSAVVRSVRHKTSGLDISPYRTNCGQPRTQGKRIDANDVGVQERARTHIERLCLVPERLERGANIPSTPLASRSLTSKPDLWATSRTSAISKTEAE